MGTTVKKIASSAIILLLQSVEWYFLITSYTPELTTENEVELVDSLAELSELENNLLSKLIPTGKATSNGVRSPIPFTNRRSNI